MRSACRGDVAGRRGKITAAAVGSDVLNEFDVFPSLPAPENTNEEVHRSSCTAVGHSDYMH